MDSIQSLKESLLQIRPVSDYTCIPIFKKKDYMKRANPYEPW